MFESTKKSISPAVCLISVVFFAGLLLTVSPSISNSQTIKAAPQNQAFLEHTQAAELGTLQSTTQSGRPLGHIPHPVDLANQNRMQATRLTGTTVSSLPEAYDLRTYGRVTPIRDQGTCGSCWTFGAMASIESRLKQLGQNRDFSEADLNQYHGFDSAPCNGGNRVMSTAYFTRWSGPVSEADVPYPYDPSLTASPLRRATPGVMVRKHVQNVDFLPERTSSTDNDIWKQMVMSFGAVDVSFLYDDSYYNENTAAFWNNVDTSANHEVAIIGWDDNYPRENFNTIGGELPAGNGAFLVRNSWGTSWGNDGYFYISYYDTSLQEATSFRTIAVPGNYNRIYEYDPLGWTNSIGMSPQTSLWGANIFTASLRARYIKAIGLYTTSPNTTVRIRVYSNVRNGQPTSGRLAGRITKTFPFAGYHTVVLPAPAVVRPLKKFSVAVNFVTADNEYPLPVEYAMSDYSSAATAYAGQSYYSADGADWHDLTGLDPTANACIKAFGNMAP